MDYYGVYKGMSTTKISRYTESSEIKILRTKNKDLSIGYKCKFTISIRRKENKQTIS